MVNDNNVYKLKNSEVNNLLKQVLAVKLKPVALSQAKISMHIV